VRKLTEPGVAERLKCDRAVSLAKAQRKKMTRAEQTLWRELRQLPLNGSHWRKQAPIGPFIVDFVCHAAKLIIEVDGEIHDVPRFAARDKEREAWLRGRGYGVLRFVNVEVLANIDGVRAKILAATPRRLSIEEEGLPRQTLGAEVSPPPPSPPRKGAGEWNPMNQERRVDAN
jgi:very-short-patch-repair endonuclease